MKTIILKTYLQELIIYINIENKREKNKTNPNSLTGADPAAPAPAAPRRRDNQSEQRSKP